jgi:hypothetical protein
MFASAVRAIQRLPVQGNLLDKNKTPIKDANLPSNKGMLITEVKGHYQHYVIGRFEMKLKAVGEKCLSS